MNPSSGQIYVGLVSRYIQGDRVGDTYERISSFQYKLISSEWNRTGDSYELELKEAGGGSLCYDSFYIPGLGGRVPISTSRPLSDLKALEDEVANGHLRLKGK